MPFHGKLFLVGDLGFHGLFLDSNVDTEFPIMQIMHA